LLVFGAFLWDLRGAATEPHPFAARTIAAGSQVGAADVVWRRLPRGSFDVPDLAAAIAAVDLAPGDPLSAAVLSGAIAIPEGWWAIPIDVSPHAGPGDEVLLVVLDPPLTLSGVVIEPQRGDATSLDHRPALVAVPGDQAPLIAAAEAAGLLVSAVRP
jgi:hypothetical protein